MDELTMLAIIVASATGGILVGGTVMGLRDHDKDKWTAVQDADDE